jgi:DNA-binding LacI/PurR family transcriptional regulator
MTASRALNGQDRVAAETRQRVMAVAQELGYRPSQSARVLRTNESKVIGLFSTILSLPLRIEIIMGVRDAAAQLGHKVMLEVNIPDDGEAIPFSTDGDLVFDNVVSSTLQDYRRTVRLMGISEHLDSVGSDLSEATYVATTHLVDRGYRRIGLIQHSGATPRIGRSAALRDLGVPDEDHEDLVQYVRYDDDGVIEAVDQLLDLPKPPDALVVVNVAGTPVALRALQNAGVHAGTDIGFVGTEVTRTEWGDLLTPSITTIKIPAYRIGAAGAQRLIERLRGDTSQPQIVDFPARLVIRDSTKGPGGLRGTRDLTRGIADGGSNS